MNDLLFIVGDYKYLKDRPNTCYLSADNWDDYGFKTTFGLIYTDKANNKIDLGTLQIMQRGQLGGFTPMPDMPFYELPDDYCSLGSGQGYYEEMMGLDVNLRNRILKSLRDCVFDKNIFKSFEDEDAMQTSLLRGVDANKVKTLYASILSGNIILTPYHFQYFINKKEDIKINVVVDPNSSPPSNVHVLIGRNGVGKTQIISGIITSLTKRTHLNLSGEDCNFEFLGDNDSQFTNLIAIVFSAFDNFNHVSNKNEQNEIPYKYVGLKKDKNDFKTPDDLSSDFEEAVSYCINSQRKDRWLSVINILNRDSVFKEYKLQEYVDAIDKLPNLLNIFKKLSSGHRIVLLTITQLVKLVDEKTLVLFDEPENHLHPPLLALFIRAISALMIERNAVALIATHSPVVLQEVPRICVTKIHRVRSEYDLSRPQIETYGENIDTLTRDVFGLGLEDSAFYEAIEDYVEELGSSYDGLIEKFGDKIGSEGRAIAQALFFDKLKINKNA